jgi:RNA polymerase sigma-70 factor, ECF subfamily
VDWLDCGCSGSTRGPKVEEPEPAEIRAAIDGDLAAFERLVRRYQAHVWRFLRHLLGDPALAEDVTQETFLRLYQRLPTFAGRSRFSTWVFRVARNAGVDALRAARRHDRLLAALPAPPPGPEPDARVEAMAAVASLRPKLREALLLVEVFGFTYREAAEVLRVPEGTVKSRVFHARVRLTAWRQEGSGDAGSGTGAPGPGDSSGPGGGTGAPGPGPRRSAGEL